MGLREKELIGSFDRDPESFADSGSLCRLCYH